MEAWCYEHGLLPRLLWPLQMYEIAISRGEWIQLYSNNTCVSASEFLLVFPKVGLYTNSGNLQLPISSLVEELKIGKVRLHMMIKDSQRDHSEGVSRNKIRYEVVGHLGSPGGGNAAYESKTSLASLKPIELVWVARPKKYSPKLDQKEKETW